MLETSLQTALPITGNTETRTRLIQAAGEVFAEQGYRRATVRNICDRAGANVAAINYHFGDKERLYRTVLVYGLKVALEKYPPDMGLPPKSNPTDQLHAYIRSLMHRMLGKGAPAWHGKLMSREMIDPTGALNSVIQETLRPLSQRLSQILHELLGPAADANPHMVQRCVFSIVGQCLFYHQAAPVVAQLQDGNVEGDARIEQLADHVFRFSLAALRCIAEEPIVPDAS